MHLSWLKFYACSFTLSGRAHPAAAQTYPMPYSWDGGCCSSTGASVSFNWRPDEQANRPGPGLTCALVIPATSGSSLLTPPVSIPNPRSARVSSLSPMTVQLTAVPQLAHPDRFSGDCCAFLIHCSLHFINVEAHQDCLHYLTCLVELMSGHHWVSPSISGLQHIFQLQTRSSIPLDVRQPGLGSVKGKVGRFTDYTIKFRTLAYVSRWNVGALLDSYPDHLTPFGLSGIFDILIALTIKNDKGSKDISPLTAGRQGDGVDEFMGWC